MDPGARTPLLSRVCTLPSFWGTLAPCSHHPSGCHMPTVSWAPGTQQQTGETKRSARRACILTGKEGQWIRTVLDVSDGGKHCGKNIRQERQPGCAQLGAAVLSRGWRHSGDRWGGASWALEWTSNVGLSETEPQGVWPCGGPAVQAAMCRRNQAHTQMMASESSRACDLGAPRGEVVEVA